MTTSRDLGWRDWFMTMRLLGAGLLRWTAGRCLATEPLTLDFVARTVLLRQTVMPPCGEVFQRPWLERLHG